MSFVRSQHPVLKRTLADALLAALSARPAGALLATPTVHLCTNVPSVTPDSVVGDFTETTYTGYAAIALPVLTGPVRDDLEVEAMLGAVNFVAPNPLTVTATITGYYVTDTGGTVLYMAEIFDTPIPVVNPGDFIDLTVAIPVDCAPTLQ